MINPELRRYELLEILGRKRFHTIEELRKQVNISHATIHRDLSLLAKRGQIRRNYGGVEVLANKVVVREYDKRTSLNVGLKEEIAREALKFVEEGDCVFIDASSTCYYFAKAILNKGIKKLTIVTNSVHIISLFAGIETGINLISTGGNFDKEFNAFLGNLVMDFISRIKLNKIFISGAGFSLDSGLSTTNDFILGMVRQALNVTDKKYCLIDSSKFGREVLLKISDLQDFDAVITDANIDVAAVKKTKGAGVKLILAKNGK